MRDKIEEILLRDDRVKDGDTDLVHVEHDIDAILSTIREELLKAMDDAEENRWDDPKLSHRATCQICGENFHMGCDCDQTFEKAREIINEKLK